MTVISENNYKCPDWLYEKHHVEKLSLRQMGELASVNKDTISYNMKKHNIDYRNRIESLKKAHEQGRVKYGVNKGRKGHPISPETRKRMVAGIRKKWKGHKTKHNLGYLLINIDGKQVLEHRHVMEVNIGRKLKPSEDVHHINGNKTDNRIENLHLFKSRSDHMYFHKMKELNQEVELRYEYK